MSGLERVDKLFNGYARLFKHAWKRAGFQFSMIGHNATLRRTTENNVTAALASNHNPRRSSARTASAPETTGKLGMRSYVKGSEQRAARDG